MKNVLSYLLNILLFALICMSLRVYAQADITCGEGDCSIPPTIDIDFKSGGETFTSFELTPRSADTTIEVGTGERPEDIRASMSQKNLFQNNITINSSGQEAANAGNVMLVSDLINELDLVLDGQSGQRGLDSIDLCGQNFLSGAYGNDARDWFAARRIVNTELDDRCDTTDVEWINTNKFICPSGFSESPNPNVDVTRYQARRKCQGVLQETRCVKRSLSVNCNFNKQQLGGCCDNSRYIWNTNQRDGNLTPPLYGSVCDPDNCNRIGASEWFESGSLKTVNYLVWEHELLSMSPELLCVAYRDTRPPTVAYLDELGNEVDYVRAEYVAGESHNNFMIPWPEVVNFPKQASPNVFNIDTARVKIYKSDSEVAISNCFGLNGSAYNDNECLRITLGEERVNGLFISFLDEEGAESNRVRVIVPEGRKVYQRAYRYSGGNNWTSCNEFYPIGNPLFTEIIWAVGNLEWGSYTSAVIAPALNGRGNTTVVQRMTGLTPLQMYNYIETKMNPEHAPNTFNGGAAQCSVGSASLLTADSCNQYQCQSCGAYECTHNYKSRNCGAKTCTSTTPDFYWRDNYANFPVIKRMNSFTGLHVMSPGESMLPQMLRCHNGNPASGAKNYAILGWHPDFPTNAGIDEIYFATFNQMANGGRGSFREIRSDGTLGGEVGGYGFRYKHDCWVGDRWVYARDIL